ncbi:30S ribosomal protein S1 [Fructilactobacillus sanfranciscensis]|uniref:30S ribosomal protein S1 n=1 Tax=Fructilactobacillus sanfranciscensis TaxID=1625 RepID=UPI000CD3AB66|nr:30S ribosomal protein S1 [Fructilactobacillus sanfranciscensis]MCG7195674.1 30S ribosomal protein S1 [Fructilactobacillus sanfranciscensis]MDN4461836.1 30S ribosomal protein S1 [Fructilactobacillus sanfranciscensis]NDR61219.1 30S ribosomal protein S1 [Fructilactobacillus sanfranciscensis]NDR97582.1 30S ribosomal protein S1 [Fructilactobacillus sanfranciscensis]POH09481.1 30S ribosomal protein S1 [Fructilactobacillus sanfranciscensis]
MSENENKQLLDALNNIKEVNVGDVVTGEILAVDNDSQLMVGIDGAGVEGVIPSKEVSATMESNPTDKYKVGDTVKVVVVSKIGDDKEGGSYLLSIRRLEALKVWDEIKEKADKGENITVKVTRPVRGGLVVNADGVRGFIPASMITDHFVSDLNQYKGAELEVKIIEVVPEDNRLILSHRAVAEKDRKEAREKIMGSLKVGDIVEGKVARLTNFGAFVDLGGIDGLVHVSEISYDHVSKPSDILKVGEDVKVKVLAIEPERNRISLSIKQLQPGPWDDIEEKAAVGSILDGTVKRLVDFGAFVEVLPGVEGLVHISQISHKHIDKPSDVLKSGEKIQVKVLSVDPEEHRLALSMKALEEAPKEENKKAPKKNVDDNSTSNAPEEESGFTLGDILGKDIDNDSEE